MNKTWLVLDVNFLAYRAFHVMGELSFGAIKTGVVYGFLKTVIELKDRFNTQNVVFCFDLNQPKRRELLECYKEKRHKRHGVDMSDEEQRARQQMQEQVKNLRKEYLPKIGYRNILFQSGYEADDMIASVVKNLPEGDEAIIVSADHDLYQLLRGNVMMYNPQSQKMMTLQRFKKEFNLHPKYWARVKAIAGCHSDEIPGVGGVGEASAIKYINGELKPESAYYKRIKAGWKTVMRNKPIVKLPFEGTLTFEPKQDELSIDGWREVCTVLGLKSLRNSLPFSGRELQKHLYKS